MRESESSYELTLRHSTLNKYAIQLKRREEKISSRPTVRVNEIDAFFYDDWNIVFGNLLIVETNAVIGRRDSEDLLPFHRLARLAHNQIQRLRNGV